MCGWGVWGGCVGGVCRGVCGGRVFVYAVIQNKVSLA